MTKGAGVKKEFVAESNKKAKREKTNNMSPSDITKAVKSAVVVRCGDVEVDDANGELRKYIQRHVDSRYKPVPHASLNKMLKDKTLLFALISGWENGCRQYLQTCPVVLCQICLPHPDKAPAGEPRSVTNNINKAVKNLVLVKHADEKTGVKTAEPFPGLSKATALVSPDLLFWKTA